MSHVEHHHGWSRQCNFGNCTSQLSSIAEFVTHHVRHVDANFEIPDTNHERNTISCLCPVCGKKSMGVNRHWEHSFIHDKVARFKCPLCDRRVNKVQNLKDHIKRHLGPQSKTKNCEICDKKFCPADIYKHMKTVHGKQDVKYPCTICGKIFPVLHKLQHHSLTHKWISMVFKISLCGWYPYLFFIVTSWNICPPPEEDDMEFIDNRP